MAKTIKEKTPAQIDAAEKKKATIPKTTTKKVAVTGETAGSAIAKETKKPIAEKSPEVKPTEQDQPQETKTKGLTYAEAEKLVLQGQLIKLPEWGGFWFANIASQEIFIFTKDGEIQENPMEEYKERNDWEIAGGVSGEVHDKLEAFHQALENPAPKEEYPQPTEQKFLTGEEAYRLLNEGKSLKHPKVPTGYIRRIDGNFKNFADNGDYLGNISFADLQDEEGWEEK